MSNIFTSKKFLPFGVSHLLSAINDNFIRTVFLFFVTYKMTVESTGLLISALLVYGGFFCAVSFYAGQVADKFSRTRLLRWLRLIEIGIMLLALASVSMNSRALFMGIIALMGATRAGIFVANYSLQPLLLPENKINTGTALLKLFSALGTIIATLLLVSVLKFEMAYGFVCKLGILFAIISYLLSLVIPPQSAQDSETVVEKNPVQVLDKSVDLLKNKFNLWQYFIGVAWFWLLGAMVLLFSGTYGHDYLHVRWSTVMFLSGVFVLGYIVGSVVYIAMTRKHAIGAYLAPVSALLSLVLLDLLFASGVAADIAVEKNLTISQFLFTKTTFTYWHIAIDILLLGALSAFYSIPLYALIQKSATKETVGRIFGFSNILNAGMIVCAGICIFALHLFSVSLLVIFGILAILNLIVSFQMLQLLPFEWRQQLFKKIFKWVFKVQVHGLENLEKAGKRALIITNHMSYIDVLLISAFVKRKIVFAINEKLMNKKMVRFITSLVEVRPLDPVSPMAVKAMVEELREDQLCMIMTEGIIADGNTRMKIYEGPAMMAYKGEAPIVPIRIDGAKHSIFSRVLGKKAEFRCFPEITLTVLEPVWLKASKHANNRECRNQISTQLYHIITDMMFDSYDKETTVYEQLCRTMKMVGRFRNIMEDATRKSLKYFSVFMQSHILGRMIKRQLVAGENHIGVMLPTSNACALTVIGIMGLGKIPAMINFSSGVKQVIATCETVGLKTVVTAQKVVTLAKLEPLVAALEEAGVRVLYLEEMAKTLTVADKVKGVLAGFSPIKYYAKETHGIITPDSPAVILFTSGSEGVPKAVFLTHKNILSNCYQALCRVDIYETDVLLNCLPMFHSLGLVGGVFLPLVLGVKIVLYPTPLHYRVIPEICASVRATIFFGTDTFLSGYAKCANPYDFNSLRLVAVGAEKLKEETRKIWLEKFGIRVLEGYGATECSPLLALNTFLHQKPGTVGKLFPGIEYQLKPVEGIKEGAELWVKGPNIMMGYMRHSAPMRLDPPTDGWYDTGDIVTVDDEGYICIKGRCKRFAKVGGEMVSLLSVELIIQKKWPDSIHGVVSIPDERKGEQIVLITTEKNLNKSDIIAAFKLAGATELGIPSKIIYTDNPPLLGTGKFDYVKAKELALEG